MQNSSKKWGDKNLTEKKNVCLAETLNELRKKREDKDNENRLSPWIPSLVPSIARKWSYSSRGDSFGRHKGNTTIANFCFRPALSVKSFGVNLCDVSEVEGEQFPH